MKKRFRIQLQIRAGSGCGVSANLKTSLMLPSGFLSKLTPCIFAFISRHLCHASKRVISVSRAAQRVCRCAEESSRPGDSNRQWYSIASLSEFRARRQCSAGAYMACSHLLCFHQRISSCGPHCPQTPRSPHALTRLGPR